MSSWLHFRWRMSGFLWTEQRRCHFLSNTVHWYVILTSQWCSRQTRHLDYLSKMSWSTIGVQLPPPGASLRDERLRQTTALPWQQWLVVISNRWRHVSPRQRRASLFREQTVWTNICHIARDNVATTTRCATVTDSDGLSNSLSILHLLVIEQSKLHPISLFYTLSYLLLLILHQC